MYYDLFVLHLNECVQDEYQTHYDILYRYLGEYSTRSAFDNFKSVLASMNSELERARRDAINNKCGIGYETNIKLPLPRTGYEDAIINIFNTYLQNSSSYNKVERMKKCLYACLSLYYHLLGRHQYLSCDFNRYNRNTFNFNEWKAAIDNAEWVGGVYKLNDISYMTSTIEARCASIMKHFFEDYRNYYSRLFDIYSNFDSSSYCHISHKMTMTPDPYYIKLVEE